MNHTRTCVKCSNAIPPRAGRPSRFCCGGCKSSAEAEIRRLGHLLGRLEEGRAVDRLNGLGTAARDVVIADVTRRLDHLYGVPAAPVADSGRSASTETDENPPVAYDDGEA